MCLTCVVFAVLESMTLPRLNAVLTGRHQSIQHSRLWSWGWFLTLVHIFHAFLSVLKRKPLVGIRENLEHQYGKIQTATA